MGSPPNIWKIISAGVEDWSNGVSSLHLKPGCSPPLGKSTVNANRALFKGSLILIGACVVLAQIIQRLIEPVLPSYEIMGIFSLAGLAANSLCLFLLWKHRNEDINMSSVWECSRNDIASNLSVFITAGAVWYFESGWADIFVASCLVFLLLNSSFRVIRSALRELHESFSL